MRLTFHISQMPNVICETNMKRDFIFSKNGLQGCVFSPPSLALVPGARKRNLFNWIHYRLFRVESRLLKTSAISFFAGLHGDRGWKSGDLHDDPRRDPRDLRTESNPVTLCTEMVKKMGPRLRQLVLAARA